MKKTIKMFMFINLFFSTFFCLSQNVVHKLKIYVIPFDYKYKRSVGYTEVKKKAKMKLVYYKSCTRISFDDLYKKLADSNLVYKDKVSDYRVLIKMKKILSEDKVYFNKFGDFYYNGKYYMDNGLFDLILPYIIDSAKTK